MKKYENVNRRKFLAGASAIAAITISGNALLHSVEAWGLDVRNLKPETMQTLIQMARDLYPHDRVADRFYAVAVKGFDDKAGSNPATKKTIEDGISSLNMAAQKKYKMNYTQIGWEADRVAVLRSIQSSSFFQLIRGTLVVSLYNQKDIWPLFGYEGESASKGGYINRGFNDISWL